MPDAFPLLEMFRADIARRRAIIGDTHDWIEAARRLHAAGEDDAAICLALKEAAQG